jgi:transcriptional antiterminator RfaH
LSTTARWRANSFIQDLVSVILRTGRKLLDEFIAAGSSRRTSSIKIHSRHNFLTRGAIMPILSSERSLFPDDLLDGFTSLASEQHWWAIYTRSRMEKSLARELSDLDIPFYLPLIPKISRIAGRPKKSLLPLFTGYLFAFCSDSQRVDTLKTKRVAHMFPAPRVDEMTDDLRNVRALIESGVPLTTEGRLQPGQRVRVKSGLLTGLEGVVVSRRGEDRLLIAVNFLQQGVSIQIGDYQVEPI